MTTITFDISSLGHNTAAGGQAKSIVKRIERLEQEKKHSAEAISEVYAEAKANGFDAKALRAVVKARKLSREAREEQQALFDLYMHAVEGAE